WIRRARHRSAVADLAGPVRLLGLPVGQGRRGDRADRTPTRREYHLKPHFASLIDGAKNSEPRPGCRWRSIRATASHYHVLPCRLAGVGVYAFGHPAVLPSVQRQSVAKHPTRDSRVPLISAVLGKRLVVPECICRCPVGQLEQQRGADVVGTVGRADWSAENEAVAVRGEV